MKINVTYIPSETKVFVFTGPVAALKADWNRFNDSLIKFNRALREVL